MSSGQFDWADYESRYADYVKWTVYLVRLRKSVRRFHQVESLTDRIVNVAAQIQLAGTERYPYRGLLF